LACKKKDTVGGKKRAYLPATDISVAIVWLQMTGNVTAPELVKLIPAGLQSFPNIIKKSLVDFRPNSGIWTGQAGVYFSAGGGQSDRCDC